MKWWEKLVDRFAYSSWSSFSLLLYLLAWLYAEKGNIGWDGWLTVIGVEIALSIRRWQNKQ